MYVYHIIITLCMLKYINELLLILLLKSISMYLIIQTCHALYEELMTTNSYFCMYIRIAMQWRYIWLVNYSVTINTQPLLQLLAFMFSVYVRS